MSEWYKMKTEKGVYYSPYTPYLRKYSLMKNHDDIISALNKDNEDLFISEILPDGNCIMRGIEKGNSINCGLPSGNYVQTIEYNASMGDIYVLKENLNRTDALSFTHEEYTKIYEDINLFLKSKEIYKEFDTMHKRGYLFYGVPGTGKTTLIRKIIAELMKKQEVICISCTEIPSFDILKKLKKDPRLKIFLFEELVTTLSSSISTKNILEFLDGEKSVDNSMFFATTNYPGDLPDNIKSRKGRFDYVKEIKKPSNEYLVNFTRSLLKRDLTVDESSALTDMTFAEVKDSCVKHKMLNKDLVECIETRKKKSVGI